MRSASLVAVLFACVACVACGGTADSPRRDGQSGPTDVDAGTSGGASSDVELSDASPGAPDATLDAATIDAAEAADGADADDGTADIRPPLDVPPLFPDVARDVPEDVAVDVPPTPPDTGEPPPELVIEPAEVDFGQITTGELARRTVTLRNTGEGVLRVRSIRFTFDSHDGLRLEGTSNEEAHVEPGGALSFDVVWDWPDTPPRTDRRLGTILVVANHSREDFGRIPVYARYDWPIARLLPKDELHFGEIAQGATGYATVLVRNAGEAPLTVHSLAIELDDGAFVDEFGIEPDDAFPATTEDGPGTVPPRSEHALTLRFTNLGPADGTAAGRLVVRTDDDLARELQIRLFAERDGDATCAAVLEPTMLDFGTVAEFGRRQLAMTLHNTGSGYCTYVGATITRCAGGDPATATCDRENGDIDSRFKVVSGPPTTNQGLPPGGRAEVAVVYAPGEAEDATALLSVTLDDPYHEGPGSSLFSVPALPPAGPLGPNLVGRCAECPMDLIPENLDFGLTTLGCTSPPQRVTVYTTDNALPLRVTGVELDADCGPAFDVEIPAIPPAGVVVGVGSPFAVALRFRPQLEGEERCDLLLHTTDPCRPLARIPLVGVGTLDTGRTDTFVQDAVHEVDVLFVVDDSGSMCEEQDNLSANLQSFVQHAQTWETDYRIGVISVCVQTSACGDLVGALRADPDNWPERWVDRHSWDHFPDNVRLGCSGNSDSQEAGLEATYLALSPPTNYLSQTSCHSDEYCINPQRCLTDIGYCGGLNGGFLRPNAALEIVVLSDEEDQSPRPVDYYVDFLKSLKGYVNEHMLHVHSIVLQGVGSRYEYVSSQTGGQVVSITNQSFGDALSEIGDVAFGLRRRFFLSNYPQPGSIEVSVDGTPYAGPWEYDPSNNSVHLLGEAATLPQEGQTIAIDYEVACVPDEG